jgi:hypothetical protein
VEACKAGVFRFYFPFFICHFPGFLHLSFSEFAITESVKTARKKWRIENK